MGSTRCWSLASRAHRERIASAAGHCDPLALVERAKLPLLARDLSALGAPLNRLPLVGVVPDVSTLSRAVGALYVVEGATLGGQIIRRHVCKRLGIEATTGARFFTGYGAATRLMWSRFGNYVDHAPSLELPAAIGAAIETFQTMTTWFDLALAST